MRIFDNNEKIRKQMIINNIDFSKNIFDKVI